MSHPLLTDLLAFVEEQAAERREIVAHVAACESCRIALVRFVQGSEGYPDLFAPPAFVGGREAAERAVLDAAEAWERSWPSPTKSARRLAEAVRAWRGAAPPPPPPSESTRGQHGHCKCWHSGDPCCWCVRDDDAGPICAARPASGICIPEAPHTARETRRSEKPT